jgi:hypothetical protein
MEAPCGDGGDLIQIDRGCREFLRGAGAISKLILIVIPP